MANEPDPVAALGRWLRSRVLFVQDPRAQETLAQPAVMLDVIERYGYVGGDCDDLATLAGALAGAVGLRVRFVVARFMPGGPWQHVFAEVSTDGRYWTDYDFFKPPDAPVPVELASVPVL